MVSTAAMSTNFLRSVKGDMGIARAQVEKVGKRLVVVKVDLYYVMVEQEGQREGGEWWEAVIEEEKMKLCATALQTLMVVPGKETWSE